MRPRSVLTAEVSRPSSYADSDRTKSTQNPSDASVPELVNDSSSTEGPSSDNTSLSNSSSTMFEVQERLPLDVNEDAQEEEADLDMDLDMDGTSGFAPTTYYYNEYPAEEFYDPSLRHTMDNTTRSLNPLDLPYNYENGRRYCGDYWQPNDEAEQTRLHLNHQVFKKSLDGQLTSIRLEDPTHILDVGAATGEWAMEMAELYPDCDVVGMDVSDVFERSAPVNCNWEVDDAELEWERPSDYYDLVHLRDMVGSFRDWQFVYDSAFRCIKPGGFVEIADLEDFRCGFQNFMVPFHPDSIVHKVRDDLDKAAVLSGKPHGTLHLQPSILYDSGFVDVNMTEYTIPLRVKDGSAGKLCIVSTLDALESYSLRLLTTYMNWTTDEVREACNQIAEEMLEIARSSKRGKGWHMTLKVLVGRKPLAGEVPQTQ